MKKSKPDEIGALRLLGVGLSCDIDNQDEVSLTLCNCICLIMDKGIDYCSSCVSEATALMLASESGVTAQPPGWSHAVGFNFHFHNWQEYAEMCEDVVALHEKALAEKNLRCATPDMSTEKNWIRV